MNLGPIGGPEMAPNLRRLTVRAVAKFSDGCEAPSLTPECPFMEYTSDGLPACAEECQDFIAEHADDLLDPNLAMGAGIGFRARRPRRGPDSTDPSYDARQQQLEDSGKALPDWRIGPLLSSARHVAYAPLRGSEGRTHDEIAFELRRRGWAEDMNLRLALARDRAVSVNFALVLRTNAKALEFDLINDDGSEGLSTASLVADMTSGVDQWEAALTDIGGILGQEDAPFLLSEKGIRAIVGWLSTKTIEDVLADLVPSIEDLRAGLVVDWDEETMLDGRWLLERFTSTFVHEWSVASLEREWQFVKARRHGCLPSGQMRHRSVDANEVAAALAEHAVARSDEDSTPPPSPEASWTPLHFKTLAIERLAAGKTEAAARIFRVLNELNDTDPDTLNNLGFCLLPTAPAEALVHLARAVDIGPLDLEITQLNMSIALHLIGRNAEALSLAIRAVESCDWEHAAFMWQFRESGLAFAPIADLSDYGDDLIDHIAGCAGSCVPVGPTLMDLDHGDRTA